MARPPKRNCSLVPHIRSFGTSKHTKCSIREGQQCNGEMGEDGVLLNSYYFIYLFFLQAHGQEPGSVPSDPRHQAFVPVPAPFPPC